MNENNKNDMIFEPIDSNLRPIEPINYNDLMQSSMDNFKENPDSNQNFLSGVAVPENVNQAQPINQYQQPVQMINNQAPINQAQPINQYQHPVSMSNNQAPINQAQPINQYQQPVPMSNNQAPINQAQPINQYQQPVSMSNNQTPINQAQPINQYQQPVSMSNNQVPINQAQPINQFQQPIEPIVETSSNLNDDNQLNNLSTDNIFGQPISYSNNNEPISKPIEPTPIIPVKDVEIQNESVLNNIESSNCQVNDVSSMYVTTGRVETNKQKYGRTPEEIKEQENDKNRKNNILFLIIIAIILLTVILMLPQISEIIVKIVEKIKS